jgi:hypothetical protein
VHCLLDLCIALWLCVQAYADGCDYLYQYSDDFQFLDDGWIDALTKRLKQTNNFGSAGMLDARREESGKSQLMTLAMAHRTHLDLLGWFWPPRLKNWYVPIDAARTDQPKQQPTQRYSS